MVNDELSQYLDKISQKSVSQSPKRQNASSEKQNSPKRAFGNLGESPKAKDLKRGDLAFFEKLVSAPS